jgi:DNA polymerase III subunit chi
MAEVFFYQLTRTGLEPTLRLLLEKSRAQGWRVVVRAQSAAMLDRLDAALWEGPEEAFLPHGREGGAHDADQPILLCLSPSLANRPDCLLCVEGAALAPEEIAGLSRAMIVFDGQDGAAVAQARAQWSLLTKSGIKAKYWSEESGRWAMKAES